MITLSLQNIENTSNPTSLTGALNNNFNAIVDAFYKTVSRESTDSVPNFMLTDFDLNGFRILNVAEPTQDTDVVRKKDLELIQAGQFRVNSITNDLEYKGPDDQTWVVLYEYDSLKGEQGDPGATGAGSGDLLASNNLSDVDNPVISRGNLGLEIGVDVMAYSSDLDGFSPGNSASLDIGKVAGTVAAGDDSRFLAYETIEVSANSNMDNWGYLYQTSSVSPIDIRVPQTTKGAVNSVYVPPSRGAVSIKAKTDTTVLVAGEVTERSAGVVVNPGGLVTILAVETDTFVVSGTGIS